MDIVSADNGREAIAWSSSDPSIDIVLMDIMMPEMDGMDHDEGDPQDPAAARTCRSSP
jgi:CheY-like chemotaxis protein